MNKVSIVIPTHGRPENIKFLLKHLEKQTFKDFEVVVIVDGGDTDIEEYKKKCPYKIIVKNLPNMGCNAARNQGIKLTNTEIVAFTDDDCIPDNDWLEKGVKYFEDSNVVGVEGLIYSERKGNPTHRTPQILDRKFNIVQGKTANMFYRKKILDEIKGFDENFSVKISRGRLGYRGDTDIAWRVKEKGKLPFAKDVKVFHPVDKTTLKKELLNSKAFVFTALLLKKHPNRIKDIIFMTIYPLTPSVPLKIYWLFVGLLLGAK